MAYQIGNTEVEGYGYITFFTLNILSYTLDKVISSESVGCWLNKLYGISLTLIILHRWKWIKMDNRDNL